MTLALRVCVLTIFAMTCLNEVEACSCGIGSRGPACQATWREWVDAVVLGRVEKIEGSQRSAGLGNRNEPPVIPLLRVTVAVEEGYKGVSAKTIDVYTSTNSAACGFAFKEGERYLIYAEKNKDGELLVSLCSSTRPAQYAVDDIAYLRSVPTLPPSVTITGTMWRYTHDPNFKPKFQPSIMDHYRPPEQEYRAMKPESGVTVVAKAQDGTEHSATVDAGGNWRIPDLSAGRYAIQPQKREGLYVWPFVSNVEIAPKGCAKVEIRVESDGRISGIVDHPAPRNDWVSITVFALPLGESDWHRPMRETTLEPTASTFDVGPLPAGKYILGAYVATKISTGNGVTFDDLGPFYFPGVTGIKGTDPIDVAEGKAVTNVRLKMMY